MSMPCGFSELTALYWVTACDLSLPTLKWEPGWGVSVTQADLQTAPTSSFFTCKIEMVMPTSLWGYIK